MDEGCWFTCAVSGTGLNMVKSRPNFPQCDLLGDFIGNSFSGFRSYDQTGRNS